MISSGDGDLSDQFHHTITTPDKVMTFTIQAYSLPEELVNFISDNVNALKCLVNSTLFAGSTTHTPAPIDDHTGEKT